ncbi:MAG: hypothetical protein IT228_02480 [Flavobacteriales bacterium]|nr:hypothetical protein [Flavobacteriales bacterium]MCC6576184.1 hypothetical protein [Flavobacteriales bacterium]NUQ16033.1 hypothetical protein [Flavobacteriales bacterium]
MIRSLRLPFLVVAVAAMVAGCSKSTSPAGNKVKQPFSGSAYESNNRFFRGTGQAVSAKQNIARSKADLDARNQLAAQVGTTVKAVTDQYLGQTENVGAAEVGDKFQTLVREVMNTEMADLRKIGEETYHNPETQAYTVYVAYEIRKAAMWRFMKQQARTNAKVSAQELKVMDELLDQQIKAAEAEGQ